MSDFAMMLVIVAVAACAAAGTTVNLIKHEHTATVPMIPGVNE